MNGATTVPSVNTINTPNNRRINIIGAKKNFLRTRMKLNNSSKNDILIRFLGFNSPLLCGGVVYFLRIAVSLTRGERYYD